MSYRKGLFRWISTWMLISVCIGVVVVLSRGLARADEIFDLGEITITATRQPRLLKNVTATVSVIGRDELETVYANRSLAEIVSQVCGVSASTYGLAGSSFATIRGSSTSQVLVLVDGRPVNTPSVGSADLSLIELTNVERIEVVRGPFSALYGSSALGGVINIVTRSADLQNRTGAEFTVGSPYEGSLHLFQSIPVARGGMRLDFKLRSAQGTRGHTRADDVAVNTEFALAGFRFSAGYQDKTCELPGPTSMPSPNASQYDQIRFLHARYGELGRPGTLQAGLFVNDQRTVYEDPDWGTKDATTNLLCGANIETTFTYPGMGEGVVGAELRQEQVNAITAGGESRIGGLRTLTNAGVYLNHELSVGDDIRADLGVRYDLHSMFGNCLTPRAGVVVQAGPLTWLRASLGSAFRAPTPSDLYWYEDWGGGMGLFGNENLEPEQSFQYEFGLEHAFGSDALGRVTWFSSEVDQLINWVETQPWCWQAQNIDTASIRGIEAEIQIDGLRPLVFKLNYQNLDARDTNEYEGKYVPYKPCHAAHVGLELPIASGQELTAYADYAGGRYSDRENTIYLEPYWLLGALLRFPATGVFFRVDNLLGIEYQVVRGYPVKGTQYSLGVSTGL